MGHLFTYGDGFLDLLVGQSGAAQNVTLPWRHAIAPKRHDQAIVFLFKNKKS